MSRLHVRLGGREVCVAVLYDVANKLVTATTVRGRRRRMYHVGKACFLPYRQSTA